jgi:pilus assembly protein CpaF
MTAVAGLNPVDALQRFLAMTGRQSAVQDLATSFSVIIHSQLASNGNRKIVSIGELAGVLDNRFIVQDIFAYDPPSGSTLKGQFLATGFTPSFLPRFEEAGIGLPSNMFKARVLLKD